MSKPKIYGIDLGFNLDVGVERTGFPLSAGLVKVPSDSTTGEGKPEWFTRMRKQATIAFRIWDQTTYPKGQEGSRGVPVCFRATWVDPSRYDDLSSPFVSTDPNPIVFSGDQIVPVTPPDCQSSVYPNSQFGWILGDPKTVGKPPLGQAFTLAGSRGSFFLRARLDVVIDGSKLHSFQWDPEVVVGGGGGESGGGGGGDDDECPDTGDS